MTTEGTYSCPICGCATPHAHSPEQIAEWREQDDIAPELCASCHYCRGDVLFMKRKAQRNESGFWFHHYEDYRHNAQACLAQPIQQRIYDLTSPTYQRLLAEITLDRKEKVRQLREEIAMVQRQLACQPDEISVLQYSADDVRNSQRNVARWSRILARLEAELARLTEGMKPEAL